MSSSLGLYIEKNLIKYAKVTRDRDELKVEAFGINFYDNLQEAIEQVISETGSQNIPISVNISKELYNYSEVPSILGKGDIKAEVEKDFEKFCTKKKVESENYETRYTVYEESGADTSRVMTVAAPKVSIDNIVSSMSKYKLSTITPLGISIGNIFQPKLNENVLVVNLEESTIITSIVNRKINDVKTIRDGAGSVLKKIAGKENSYSKAYEICKNSTIYTIDAESQEGENEYMDIILPTLNKIVTSVQRYIDKSKITYDKIYITGTLSVVNNVDLYFQEFFQLQKCEILRPYFIKDIFKINIKDYIEVNSAISLAMQDLGYGLKDINFQKQTFSLQMSGMLNKERGSSKKSRNGSKKKKINFDMTGELENSERWMLRVSALIAVVILAYCIFSIYMNSRINSKLQEADDSIAYTDSQIELADEDIELINEKSDEYVEMLSNLSSSSSQLAESMDLKGAIPNLLINIMSVIPEDVQVTKIENTVENNGRHIVLTVQSEYYDELGYFKVKLKEDEILTDVVSTQGEQDGDYIKMVIEGDLP